MLPSVMHLSRTQLFLIRKGHHAPPTPYIALPTKAVIPFQTSGLYMLSELSKTTLEGDNS